MAGSLGERTFGAANSIRTEAVNRERRVDPLPSSELVSCRAWAPLSPYPPRFNVPDVSPMALSRRSRADKQR
jgi:hypothetical protein